MKRQDFPPIAPPPNPRAVEAREAIRGYAEQMRSETTPAPKTDAELITACLLRWPDMLPYAATARVERGCVIVTIFERGV